MVIWMGNKAQKFKSFEVMFWNFEVMTKVPRLYPEILRSFYIILSLF